MGTQQSRRHLTGDVVCGGYWRNCPLHEADQFAVTVPEVSQFAVTMPTLPDVACFLAGVRESPAYNCNAEGGAPRARCLADVTVGCRYVRRA